MLQVLQVSNLNEIVKLLREIGVDPYGINIMAPKGLLYLVKVDGLPSFAANILKQEMLSLGADAAVAKGALTGKIKKTSCILIGNLSQFLRLNEKLKLQPFGLNGLAEQLKEVLDNYNKINFTLELGRYKLNFNKEVAIMGILNITPDSFSGDGLYGCSLDRIREIAEQMSAEGADCIDIGGESSRPGARAISAKEEIARVLPVIKMLTKKIKIPLSVDTYKPEVAKVALDNGVSMINDITGLSNEKMRRIIAKFKAAAVIMHMQGRPQTMQVNPHYQDVCAEVLDYLEQRVNQAVEAGIPRSRMMIDPGIGFGKTVEHNLILLKKLKMFYSLGLPILVGCSRKSFIGKLLNVEVNQRVLGTLSASLVAAQNGAHMLRVHDVKELKQGLKILQAIRTV